MEIYKGKIKEFQGSWNSGLGALVIENEAGNIEHISCDNGATVRALEDAFGNVITDGHTANGQGYKDKEIFYSMESWGVMAGFQPVGEASPELIDKYEKDKKAGAKLPETIKNRRRIIREVL